MITPASSSHPGSPAPGGHRHARASIAVAGLLALLVLPGGSGCGSNLRGVLVPNQPPEVRITEGPVVRDSLRPTFYHATIRWTGHDPDGRVEHFHYAVDPVSIDRIDSTWVRTTASEARFSFEASGPTEPIDPRIPMAMSPHTIAIHSVDDRGDRSLVPATRSFFAATVAPQVQITDPRPTTAFTVQVPTTVRFVWTGTDLDGQLHFKPVRYAYRLFGARNPDVPRIVNFIDWMQLYPDSLRRIYAPAFEGWAHVGGDTTSAQFRLLVPGNLYAFAVTGFDEAGAYDPVFAFNRNILKFGVTYSGLSGPVIHMYSDFFDYTYATGGYSQDPSREFRIEVAGGQPVTVNWNAQPTAGADIRRYRWVMDLVDLEDETPRSNEATDWYHWSTWSLNVTSATVGPFGTDAEEHLFYIEVEDSNGLTSLGIIRFRVVVPSFDKPLLFVSDTRLVPDLRRAGSTGVDPPRGPWPTAAELDTFLFARGGFPWKSYPAGTLSPPGIANGYSFDTLGTRWIPGGQVPLSALGRYRHVVWLVDDVGASYFLPPGSAAPMTSLRAMSQPGRSSTLHHFVRTGGRLWLAGGGAAYASLIPWNRAGTSPHEYTNRDGELVPGRLVYDFVHWRSSVQILPAVQARRFGTTSFGVGPRPGRGWPGQPDYTALPATLQPRSPATDPPPPLRNPDSFFYLGTYTAEYLNRPNFIRENSHPHPDSLREVSTLDTLYLTAGGTALPNAPVMTYYHGADSAPLVMSGFPPWHWQRGQCIALLDFVLGRLWGLPRNPSAPRTPVAVRHGPGHVDARPLNGATGTIPPAPPRRHVTGAGPGGQRSRN